MKKRIAFIMATVCVLLITGCGDSNSMKDSAGTDNQIKVLYAENAGQNDTEENIVICRYFSGNNGEINFNPELLKLHGMRQFD